MEIFRSETFDCWFSGSFGISVIIISIFVLHKQKYKKQIAFYSCMQMELFLDFVLNQIERLNQRCTVGIGTIYSLFVKEVITFYDGFTAGCFAT